MSFIYKCRVVGDVSVPKKVAGNQRAAWEVDFIHCELSREERDAVAKWDVKYEATFDLVARLVSDGYKLSVTADRVHDCSIASITSPKGDAGIRQQCLTARGPDFFGAIRCLAYKHAIVLEGDWGEVGNAVDTQSKWG